MTKEEYATKLKDFTSAMGTINTNMQALHAKYLAVKAARAAKAVAVPVAAPVVAPVAAPVKAGS